jgi:HPt (histidine-containing phosphotransfer) domain-containing protein
MAVERALMDQPCHSGRKPAAGTAPVNETTLQHLAGGDRSLRDDLLQRFVESASDDIGSLAASLAATDIQALIHATHRARGASLMVGAEHFAALLDQLQRQPAPAPQLQGILEALRAEAEKLERYLEQTRSAAR